MIPAQQGLVHHGLEYRPDIDGLRAVAVVSVMLFHAGVPYLSGGFVGVDVFFVISGYLITSIILKDLGEGTFSFLGFYERRVRRILPALLCVTFATTLIALAILPPYELERYGRALIATLLFSSNFYFWEQSGYFAEPAEQEFLLHTWSLSVEEQFYILWPLCLWILAWPAFRRARGYVLPGLVAASLVASEFLANAYPEAGFYLIVSRFWELGLGALLAVGRDRAPASAALANAYGAAGLALIAYAVVAFGPDTTFPGLSALLPCAGAALLIYSGRRRTLSARLLELRPVVFVGLISYSLYLWHWPLLTLAKFHLARSLTPTETVLALAAAVALSAASWRWVELPFRRRTAARRRPVPVLLGGAGSILALGGLGGVLIDTHGLPFRAPPELVAMQAETLEYSPLGDACWADGGEVPPAALCTIGKPGRPTIVVWGDSHADPWAAVLARRAEADGFAMRQITKAGCPPVLDAVKFDQGRFETDCREFNGNALREILEMPDLAAVVMIGRWSLYTETHSIRSAERLVYLVDDRRSEFSVETSRQVLSDALRRTVAALDEAGIRTVIVAQPPEFPGDVPPCVISSRWRGGGEDHCFITAARSRDRLAYSAALIGDIDRRMETAVALYPDRRICDEEMCRGAVRDAILYRDDHHLSVPGAETSVAELLDLVFAPPAAKSVSAERQTRVEALFPAGEASRPMPRRE